MELPHIEGIKEWVARMPHMHVVVTHTHPPPSPHNPVTDPATNVPEHLWELDIKDFFPTLAVRKVAESVARAKNKRVDKRFGMWFRICHDTTSLNGIRKGSPDQFVNVCDNHDHNQ